MEAGFPRDKWLGDFDFDANPNINPARINTLATRLENDLVEVADEKDLARTIARYGRVDLPTIDELGYVELDRRGAELLFQVLTEREENNSIAIASN